MKKGVSTFIAFALIILFLTFAVVLVMTIVTPTLDRAKDSGIVTEAFSNLELINSAIKEVASESQGSKRTISLTVSGGDYKIEKDKEWIYFEYKPKTDLGLGGARGDVKIESGLAFLDFFNQYIEGSNGTPFWEPDVGTWNVTNNAYKLCGGSSTRFSQIKNLTFGDGTFEVKFKIINPNDMIHVAFRGINNTHRYDVTASSAHLNLVVFPQGSAVASADVQIATNTWYTLRIEADKSSIKVYLDGVPRILTMDGNYSIGSFNALGSSMSYSCVWFDDVKVTTGKKDIKLIIPYSKIDLNGTDRFSTGNHQIEIENKGLNSTTNKPIVNIKKV
jgi:hypothetical protein